MRTAIEYASIAHVVQEADRAAAMGRIHQGSWERSVCRGEEFIGRKFRSWTECKQACFESWKDGIDRVTRLTEKIEHGPIPMPRRRTRKTRFSDDVGDEFDLDRFRSGQGYWRRSEREYTEGPQNLVIAVNVATYKFVSPRQLAWRGVTAIVLADILEQAGYRVTLVGVRATNKICQMVTLKSYEQPLDLPNVVNGLSGWFYRTVMFQASHAADNREARGTEGMTPTWLHDQTDELVNLAGGSHLIVLDNIWSEDRAVAKVTEVLRTLRGDPEPEPVVEVPEVKVAVVESKPAKKMKMPKLKPVKFKKADYAEE